MDEIRRRRGSTARNWMIGVALIALALAPITCSYRSHVRDISSARNRECHSSLHNVSLALAMYENVHGSLPPAVVLGPDGKPWHSWRVLILPDLEEGSLFRSYRFDEPWDGPNNRRLIPRKPRCYHCPTEEFRRGMPAGQTSVVAVVGPGTCFPPDRTTRHDDFAGSPGRPALLTELAASGIPWTAPVDLDVETFLAQSALGEGSAHPSGRRLVFPDLRVRFLPFPIDEHSLGKLRPDPPVVLPDVEQTSAGEKPIPAAPIRPSVPGSADADDPAQGVPHPR